MFAEFIRSQTASDSECLVSFDTVSLFTDIPTDDVIDAACRKLKKDDSLVNRTALTVDSIIILLTLCLESTFLRFRDVSFRSTFNTAMGSPVSVTVTNLVMEEIKEQALQNFQPQPRF